MTLPRLPEDHVILDMIRAGVNTIPGIAHKIYGYPPELEWIRAKSKVMERMQSLKKYGFVRQTGETVQMGYGRNVAKIWEVIE